MAANVFFLLHRGRNTIQNDVIILYKRRSPTVIQFYARDILMTSRTTTRSIIHFNFSFSPFSQTTTEKGETKIVEAFYSMHA